MAPTVRTLTVHDLFAKSANEKCPAQETPVCKEVSQLRLFLSLELTWGPAMAGENPDTPGTIKPARTVVSAGCVMCSMGSSALFLQGMDRRVG